MISPQELDKKKSMKTIDKYVVQGSFKLKTYRHNIMYILFYSNIYEFAGNLEGILDKGTKNKYRICTSLVVRNNSSSPLMF